MKGSLMSRAFDDFAEHEPVSQEFFFVRAKPVGGIKPAWSVIHGIDLSAVLKLPDIFFGNLVNRTDRVPGNRAFRHSPSPRPGRRFQCAKPRSTGARAE